MRFGTGLGGGGVSRWDFSWVIWVGSLVLESREGNWWFSIGESIIGDLDIASIY